MLVFEDIEGAPPVLPWEAAELARVLDAVAELGGGPDTAPTLREFQAAEGRTALAWLKVRTTWR